MQDTTRAKAPETARPPQKKVGARAGQSPIKEKDPAQGGDRERGKGPSLSKESGAKTRVPRGRRGFSPKRKGNTFARTSREKKGGSRPWGVKTNPWSVRRKKNLGGKAQKALEGASSYIGQERGTTSFPKVPKGEKEIKKKKGRKKEKKKKKKTTKKKKSTFKPFPGEGLALGGNEVGGVLPSKRPGKTFFQERKTRGGGGGNPVFFGQKVGPPRGKGGGPYLGRVGKEKGRKKRTGGGESRASRGSGRGNPCSFER